MDEKEKLLEMAKQKLKHYQKKKANGKSKEVIVKDKEIESSKPAANDLETLKEPADEDNGPESTVSINDIEALRREITSLLNLVDSQAATIANQKSEKELLLLELKEKSELEINRLKEMNLLLEKNEFLSLENVNYSKRIDELVKQTVELTRNVAVKDIAQDIQASNVADTAIQTVDLLHPNKTGHNCSDMSIQTSPATAISGTLLQREIFTQTFSVDPEVHLQGSELNHIHQNKKLKKKSIDPTYPHIEISALTTKLLSLEQQNLAQQQKIVENEKLITKIQELECINQELRSRVKDDERVIILLEAQVDEIPDMIFHYHQERKELLKRINIGNFGIAAAKKAISPRASINAVGEKFIGTGVSVKTTNRLSQSLTNLVVEPTNAIAIESNISATCNHNGDDAANETLPLLANESFELLQYRNHSELVCCECVNSQMIFI